MKKLIICFLILNSSYYASSPAMEYEPIDLEEGRKDVNYVIERALDIIFMPNSEFNKLKNAIVDEDNQFAAFLQKIITNSPEAKHWQTMISCNCFCSKKSPSMTIACNRSSFTMGHRLYMTKNADETIKLERLSMVKPWVPVAMTGYGLACVWLTGLSYDLQKECS